MVRLSLVALALSAIGFAQAQSGLWAQCGGTGWNGPTTCISGCFCEYYNPFYSQCIPQTNPTSTTSTTSSKPSSSSSTSHTTSTTTTTTTTHSTTTTTSTSSSASVTPSGVQIIGITAPVNQLYLQPLAGVPVVGPQTSGGRFSINGYIELLSIPGLYLNVVNSTTSYKVIAFGANPSFTGWALEGATVTTGASSIYGRQLNFLACPTSTSGDYQIYLQMGSDTPSSSCTITQMQVA